LKLEDDKLPEEEGIVVLEEEVSNTEKK